MLKLIKEVFKSLSKSRILLGCLAFLIFLSSGIFTLLLDIRNTYNSQFQDYKNVSKLHDLTVDLDLKASGQKPNNIFLEKESTFFSKNNIKNTQRKIILSDSDLESDPHSNEKYIKASKILNSSFFESNSDFYINVSEFLNFIKINPKITEYINSLESLPDSSININSSLFSNYLFQKYSSPGILGTTNEIKLTSQDTFSSFNDNYGQKIKLSQIVDVIKGEDDGFFFSGSHDKIVNVKNIFVNVKTKEASLSIEKKNLWEKENVLFILTSSNVAKMLGFKLEDSRTGTYIVDNNLKQNLFFLPNYSGKLLRINPNATVLPTFNFNINETFNLNWEFIIKPKSSFLLDEEIKLNKLWIKKIKTITQYKKKHFILNYDFDSNINSQWSGIYKDFLDSIKNNNDLKNHFSKTTYWEKYNYIFEVDDNDEIINSNNFDFIKEEISSLEIGEILVDNLTSPTLETTILMEGEKDGIFSSNEVSNALANLVGSIAIELLNRINDQFLVSNLAQEIEESAKGRSTEKIYLKIKELVGIENIGIRENTTITSLEENKNNVYHMINVGDNNQEIKLNNDIKIKQNVDVLYEEAKNNEESLLFKDIDAFDPNSYKTLKIYTPQIISKLFSGYSLDYDYLNPIFYYGNYTYSSSQSKNNIYLKNQRIILLNNEKNNQKLGITYNQTEKKYYLLTTPTSSPFLEWNVIYTNSNQKNDLEFLEDLVFKKNYIFSNVNLDNKKIELVGKNGWAKQDSNYSNKYYVPFKLILPSSQLINDYNNGNGFEYFSENLIQYLTPVLKNVISEKDIKILLDAVNTSFTNYGFGTALNPPAKLSTNVIIQCVMGALYHAALYDGNDFIGNLFTNIIDKGLNLDSNDANTNITSELNTLSFLLKTALGINIDLNQIFNTFFKDSKLFFSAINDLIKSINWDKSVIKIFENYFNNGSVANSNIGIGDILPIILENTNENLFKSSLKKMVSNIKFNTIFDEIFNSLSEEDKKIYGNIIKQLNGNEDLNNPDNNYSNVNDGLAMLIDCFSLNDFRKTINDNIRKQTFQIYDEDNQLKIISVNTLTINELISSFLISLSPIGINDELFADALIKLANLSSKTQGTLGVYQPVPDPNKLDLYDLTDMLVSKSPEINSSSKELEKIKNKISGGISFSNLSKDEQELLNKYLLLEKETTLNSLTTNELINRIDYIKDIFNEGKFQNFDINAGKLGSFISNNQVSIADEFIYLIHPDTASGGFVESILKSTIYKQFYNENKKIQEYDMLADILSFFNFWLNFSKKLLENQKDPISEINSLLSEIKNNKNINDILKKKSYKFNVIPTFSPDLYDGFTNAKEVALNLAAETERQINNNEKTWIPIEIISHFFTIKDGKVLVNSKTFSLVSSLTFLISDPNSIEVLIKNNFVNTFLSSKNYEEQLLKISLALKLDNTLNGPIFNVIENLGLSSVIMSSFSGVMNPGVLLWYTVNQNAEDSSSIGNLQYIIKEKLYKLDSSSENILTIGFSGFQDILSNFIPENTFLENPYNPETSIPLVMDLETLRDLYLKLSEIDPNDPDKRKDLLIFGVNINQLISGAIKSFVEIRLEQNEVVAYNVSSYFAKINHAFLSKNNKEIYKFKNEEDIPKTSSEMEIFLRQIESKFKINVNGIDYLIIGADSTADYLYPVIDSNNIQVNTNSQALVYVNQYGFDRARQSNSNSFVDKYLLVRKGNYKGTLKELQNEINLSIFNILNGTHFTEINDSMTKYAYLYNEFNSLYPERAIRLTTVEEIINQINTINLYISFFLIILIGIIVIFIIRRYISSRSKILGILKAQGYSKLQISLSICVLGFIVALIGGALGYILGHFLQIPLMNIFSTYWTLPISPIPFNIWSLFTTIIMPFVGISLLTILTSLSFLRIKSMSLINGEHQLNNSKIATKINGLVSKTSIKNKFAISLALNSVWKLISLFFALLITSSITIFAFSSNGIFNKVTSLTYKNKKYNYKIDLVTPTKEGGYYNKINEGTFEDMLFVPTGNPNEGNTYLNDYFKPGHSSVINVNDENGNPLNGNPINDMSHIISKSSLDLSVKAGAVNINVWNTLFNSLPESQKSQLVKISQNIGFELEKTQDIIIQNIDNQEIAISPSTGEKVDYFKYLIDDENPKNSRFIKRILTNDHQKYINKEIVIGDDTNNDQFKNLRNDYRTFLVTGYNKLQDINKTMQDYFLIFGGIKFNNETDETYSWIEAVESTSEKQKFKIYGYKDNSKYIQILDSSGKNLINEANIFYEETGKYPLIINNVVAKLYGLGVGSKYSVIVNNDFNRNLSKLDEKINNQTSSPRKISFEIIGINDTFINEEWITSQKVANDILGLDNINNSNNFNGILSVDENPSQLSTSLSLYSSSGYWAADQLIDTNYNIQTADSTLLNRNRSIFWQLFYTLDNNKEKNISVVANNLRLFNSNLYSSEKAILDAIEKLISVDIDKNNDGIIDQSEENNLSNASIKSALDTFISIYGKDILIPIFSDVTSKDIESGFVNQTSSTINSLSIILLVVSFLISITILILISTLIINENEKNIAIFGILGYSSKEKMRMFLSIYFPILFLAILLSIPLTLGFTSLFVTAILNTTLMVLPISISALHIISSSLFILVIFSISLLIAWLNINKVKPIILLKGD
ncbi:MAG: FtsX-like permease family protein [Metamycoplasmataceae bacterium]